MSNDLNRLINNQIHIVKYAVKERVTKLYSEVKIKKPFTLSSVDEWISRIRVSIIFDEEISIETVPMEDLGQVLLYQQFKTKRDNMLERGYLHTCVWICLAEYYLTKDNGLDQALGSICKANLSLGSTIPFTQDDFKDEFSLAQKQANAAKQRHKITNEIEAPLYTELEKLWRKMGGVNITSTHFARDVCNGMDYWQARDGKQLPYRSVYNFALKLKKQ